MSARALLVNVATLRGRPGKREDFNLTAQLDELVTSGASVDAASDVTFNGTIEAIEGARLVVTGDIHAHWSGECRRCLTTASGDITPHLREIFEDDATEGETYPVKGDVVDLEPMVREAVMLEIPVAPLCKEDCAGLCPECGADRNVGSCDCVVDLSDPRWAALDALKDPDNPA